MPHAQGGTLIGRASGQAAFARKEKGGQLYITNESVMDGNSSTPPCTERTLRTKKFSKFEIISSSFRSCQDRTSDWNFEVLKSAGTLVTDVKTPSEQPGKSNSWERISRGSEQYPRQFVPAKTDHQNIEAAPSQQSVSCGRPRAQETGGYSPVRFKSAPKPKLLPIGWFQSTSLEIDSSNSVHQKRLRTRTHLQALNKDSTSWWLS